MDRIRGLGSEGAGEGGSTVELNRTDKTGPVEKMRFEPRLAGGEELAKWVSGKQMFFASGGTGQWKAQVEVTGSPCQQEQVRGGGRRSQVEADHGAL